MSFFDEAEAIKIMLDMRGLTRGELAKSLGVTVSAISNKLRLLSLDEEVKAAVIANKLTERHARLLLRLGDKEKQLRLIEEIADRNLTVAQTEACMEIKYLNNTEITDNPQKQIIPCPEEAKDMFIENIKKSIQSLSALGVSATLSTSLHGQKSYITIIIGE
ncbi:MAG: hypothetical protein J6D20_04240 [Clostridia bacterium]|nr:hypothetical protein [Clostridia bacterium]